MLLGSVLAATDGAAIFALLRGSTLKRRLATTLEGESGFNDPVAVLLVLRRAPFPVVVLAAAATTAGLRLLGVS